MQLILLLPSGSKVHFTSAWMPTFSPPCYSHVDFSVSQFKTLLKHNYLNLQLLCPLPSYTEGMKFRVQFNFQEHHRRSPLVAVWNSHFTFCTTGMKSRKGAVTEPGTPREHQRYYMQDRQTNACLFQGHFHVAWRESSKLFLSSI